MAATEDALARLVQARKDHDWNAEFWMKRGSLLTPLDPGARVTVRYAPHPSKSGAAFVSVDGGMYAGQTGWVAQAWLSDPRGAGERSEPWYPDLGAVGLAMIVGFTLLTLSAPIYAAIRLTTREPARDRHQARRMP